jgi:hypothetical protein
MEEQVNQEVVAQPSGQTENVSPEVNVVEAAQPEPQITEVAEQAQTTTAEPVLTEQKILELVSKAAREAAAETLREVQSRTDKAEARIRKEVQEQIDRLKNIGVELSPEQVGQLDAQTRQKFEQQSAPKPPANPIDAVRDELEKEYGIELSNDDLESKLVVVDGTPRQFLSTYEKALQAKKDRLNSAAKSNSPQKVETKVEPKKEEDPKARTVTSPVRGAVGLTVTDPDVLFKQAYSKK